jgi:hypothetical protein
MNQQVNEVNQRLGELITADRCFLAGTSKTGRGTISRPAFSNRRACESNVEALATVAVEPGSNPL